MNEYKWVQLPDGLAGIVPSNEGTRENFAAYVRGMESEGWELVHAPHASFKWLFRRSRQDAPQTSTT